MALGFPAKDPDSKLDYTVNWVNWIPEGDSISDSEWIIPSPLVKVSDVTGATSTTIWLTGGVVDETYELVNRITTTGGRIQDQTCKIKCKEL